jgi:putative membrane protein
VEVENNLMWGFGFGGGLMFLGPLFMILILVAIYFIITSSSRGNTHVHYRQQYPVQDHYPSQGRAIEVLNERFAKGEITREQFLQMRQTMEAT